jgi:subtilisin family serine protease
VNMLARPSPSPFRQRLNVAGLAGSLAVLVTLGSALPVAADGTDAPATPPGEVRQESPEAIGIAKLIERSKQAPVRVIVEFSIDAVTGRAHRPEPTLSATEATAQRQAIQQVGNALIARLGGASYGAVTSFTTLPLLAFDAGPEALRRLAKDPQVLRIQEDSVSAPDLATSVPLIGADEVWADGFTGAGVVVAVLDTGVDADHPFLAGKVVSEACYSTNASNATSVCPGGVSESTAIGSGRNCAGGITGCDHGTHVAGIAAGKGNAFSGVARDAGLIAIQVFSRFSGSNCADNNRPSPCALTFNSDQIRGLERVLQLSSSLDIAAANMSLGGGAFGSPCDNDLRKLAIDNLRAAGIATVIASGNDGFDGLVGTPGCISSAITVGSTTRSDQVSGFSNHAALVDLMAPGSNIESSVPGTRFASFSGTSMATPHVAGSFALLHDAAPNASVDEIETALEGTGVLVSRGGLARPRIQVDAALGALLGSSGRPLNDAFGAAAPLAGLSGSETGTNVASTAQPGEPSHAGVGGGRSVWWSWRPTQSGTADLSTFGSDYDTVLAVYTGAGVRGLTEVASNDDSAGELQSQVQFAATAGTTYHVAVDGFAGAEGNIVLNYELNASGGGANDNFGRAIVLAGPAGVVTGSNQGATAQPGEPTHAGEGGGHSVWWRWRAPASGDTLIGTLGSDFDTVLGVYRGRSVRSLNPIAANDDGPDLGVLSLVRFDAEAGVNYRIAVDGYRGAAGNITLVYANLSSLPAQVASAGDHAAPDPAAQLWSRLSAYAGIE